MDVPLGKQKMIASFPVMSWGKLKSLTLSGFSCELIKSQLASAWLVLGMNNVYLELIDIAETIPKVNID